MRNIFMVHESNFCITHAGNAALHLPSQRGFEERCVMRRGGGAGRKLDCFQLENKRLAMFYIFFLVCACDNAIWSDGALFMRAVSTNKTLIILLPVLKYYSTVVLKTSRIVNTEATDIYERCGYT